MKVIKLQEKHKIDIINHYDNLNTENKQSRFGYTIKDYHLHKFIANLDLDKDHHFGVYLNEELIGLAQLSPIPKTNIYEFGISVNQDYQRQGLSKTLWTAVIKFAKKQNIKEVYLQHNHENAAMRAFCRNIKMTMQADGSDRVGYLNVAKY